MTAEDLCRHLWKLLEPAVGGRGEVGFAEFRKIVEARVREFPESEVLELLEFCGYIDLGEVGHVRILRNPVR